MPSPLATATTAEVAARRSRTLARQPGAAVGHLLVHVRDVEARHLARAREQRRGGVRVVRVDVDAEGAVVAHDQHRVAEPLELGDEDARVEALAGDGEVRAVAEARRLVLRAMERRRARTGARARARPAAQRGETAGDDHGEPVGARVDHARLAQHRAAAPARARPPPCRPRARSRAPRRAAASCSSAVASGPSRCVSMCARSCATRLAIARTAVSIVPSAGSRTERVRGVGRARERGGRRAPGPPARPGREASSSAAPRTICDRITPLLPRAPSSAARATALTISSRPADLERARRRAASSSSTTARMVSAMLSPVSPSATGKTLRSLTSWRRFSSSSRAAATTRRKRIRLSSAGTVTFLHLSRAGSGGLGDLAGLEAARADVLAPGRAPDVDADLLEVRVEAALRRNHRVAAAVPERGALSARVTDLCHGAVRLAGVRAPPAARSRSPSRPTSRCVTARTRPSGVPLSSTPCRPSLHEAVRRAEDHDVGLGRDRRRTPSSQQALREHARVRRGPRPAARRCGRARTGSRRRRSRTGGTRRPTAASSATPRRSARASRRARRRPARRAPS